MIERIDYLLVILLLEKFDAMKCVIVRKEEGVMVMRRRVNSVRTLYLCMQKQ